PFPAKINSVTVSNEFSQTNTCTTPVPAHGSCRIAVSFTPSMNENAAGAVTATTYGPGAVQPSNLYAPGLMCAALTVNPLARSFAGSLLGAKNGPQIVNVTNAATSSISVTGVKTASPFSQTNNCLGNLAAGASCQIQVYFTPNQLNPVTGTIQIAFAG